MTAARDFYNDNDPAACAWMGELMAGGHIPAGRIDSRSILDVRPTDLSGFRRAHFFAGIGGWAEALRIAGWEGPCWTGSPPCQPFSAAGKRAGRDDDRHLGPAFVELVRACRPPVLFGEQVASADVVGRASGGAKRGAGGEPEWSWCDDLFVRLEAAGYACGAAVVPACSVGAPHIRARLFFGAVRMEDAELPARQRQRQHGGAHLREQEAARPAGRCVADELVGDTWLDAGMLSGGMADAGCVGVWRQQPGGLACPPSSHPGREEERQRLRLDAGDGGSGSHRPGPTGGFWRDADWLGCRDGKWRPAQSSVQRVVDGIPGSVVPSGSFVSAAYPLAQKQERRVMRLRGYGNAIVPQAAAAFIRAFSEAVNITRRAAA